MSSKCLQEIFYYYKFFSGHQFFFFFFTWPLLKNVGVTTVVNCVLTIRSTGTL